MNKQAGTKIDWIFFDVGGVLVDELAVTRRRQEQEAAILQEFGVSATAEEIRTRWSEASSMIGSIDQNIFKLFLKDDQLVDQANIKLREWAAPLPTYIDLAEPRKEALSVLAELKNKYKLGLIANQSPKIRAKLEAAGLLKFFDNHTVSHEYGFSKPDPRIFEAVFKETGADPIKSVMIDDNIERGLVPAKKLGMTTVWYKSEEREAPADTVDFTIESFLGLLDIFK